MRNDAAAKARRRQRALERQPPEQAAEPFPRYPVPDTPKEMLAFAESLGWVYTKTRDGYRFLHPSGATACMHLTISDKAGWRNLRADLLRPLRQTGSTIGKQPL